MANWFTIAWKVLNSKAFVILVFCIIGSIFITKSDRYFGWTNPAVKQGEPITTDGAGYYAYLPQWFTYHSSHFEFMDAVIHKYPQSKFQTGISRQSAHHFLNKYYTGTAVSLVPFYAIANIHAKWSGHDQDGYSKPYLLWINLGSIFYLLFGCAGFYFLMRRFQFDRFWILIGCLALAFGTNACYYATALVPFAHVFSFATITWMLFFAKKWSDDRSKIALLACFFFLGWAIIIRPTGLLALVFIPFLVENWSHFNGDIRFLLKEQKRTVLGGFFLLMSMILFQLFQVYQQTGQLQINTYDEEAFTNWAHPEWWNVLFSWRKGLFIFAPVLLLLFPGCYVLFRKNKYQFFGLVFTLVLIGYVVSSWWCWWYGGGLGMRVFIDYFALLFLPIVGLLHHSKKMVQVTVLLFIAGSIYMYSIFDFQMRKNILHYEDMNFEQFSAVFMKTDQRFQWVLYQEDEVIPRNVRWDRKYQVFTSHQQSLARHTVKLAGPDDGDNAVCNMKFPVGQASETKHLGAMISGTFLLQDPETNPNYWIRYFQDDSLVHQSNVYFGGKITELNNWKKISIPFNAPLNSSDFDSIAIVLLEGGPRLGVRNLSLRTYCY